MPTDRGKQAGLRPPESTALDFFVGIDLFEYISSNINVIYHTYDMFIDIQMGLPIFDKLAPRFPNCDWRHTWTYGLLLTLLS